MKTPRYLRTRQPLPVGSPDILHNGHRYRHDPFLPEHRPAATGRIQFELQLGNIQAAAPMPFTSPGNDDGTGDNHQPTLRKNTAEPAQQTLKQYTPTARTAPPRPSTAGSRPSGASPSASATSTTTSPEDCSTPEASDKPSKPTSNHTPYTPKCEEPVRHPFTGYLTISNLKGVALSSRQRDPRPARRGMIRSDSNEGVATTTRIRPTACEP